MSFMKVEDLVGGRAKAVYDWSALFSSLTLCDYITVVFLLKTISQLSKSEFFHWPSFLSIASAFISDPQAY